MDGNINQVLLSGQQVLQDILTEAMKAGVPFNEVRKRVYEWAKTKSFFLLGCDRLAVGDVSRIVVEYQSPESGTITYWCYELPRYTKAQPISTW